MQKTSVFLSSTSDLGEHREAVAGAIAGLDRYECSRMEEFGARDESPLSFCRRRVAQCDVFVALIGPLRGGSAPGTTKSFVELEYEAAVETGKPRLIFLSVKDFPVRADFMEAQSSEDRERQNAFRERLGSERIRDEFSSSTQELQKKVAVALSNLAHDSPDSERVAFVKAYRQRLWAFYSHWDLGTAGVVQVGSGRAPVRVTLDDMYVPLRLYDGYDARQLERGKVVSPGDIINDSGRCPFVIRGSAGAGKTTWMRWTFRQLLKDVRAFPVMIELRRLSLKFRQANVGADRSLDTYLEQWARDEVGPQWQQWLSRILQDPRDLTPVLLVDGWDELGDLGEFIRWKLLGFMKERSAVRVIVSSRPYGRGRPSHGDDFQTLDLQPLSDQEVAIFTKRFYSFAYGSDDPDVEKYVAEIGSSLERSPEARALARTPLLLTMMLLIGRSRALPDERHKLFEICVDSLINAIPQKKGAQGAAPASEEWRPERDKDCFRAVAALAHDMQSDGYASGTRGAVVIRLDEMQRRLPQDWAASDRNRFLRWLIGPAGILVDRSDGEASFCHVSFQEYLTAWHLNAILEGDAERVDLCNRHVRSLAWWETLRLWAALVESPNPKRLNAVFASLLADDDCGLWLAGAMLADGVGSNLLFETWAEKTCLRLVREGLPTDAVEPALLCAQAWSRTRQDDRRRHLCRMLSDLASEANWLEWMRCSKWAEEANLGADVTPASRSAGAVAAALSKKASGLTEREVATGRILCGGSPLWPGGPPWELALLQMWPSRRRLAGMRLQSMANLQLSRQDIVEAAKVVMAGEPSTRVDERVQSITGRLSGHTRADYSDGSIGDLVRDLWVHPFVRYWVTFLGTCGDEPKWLDFYNVLGRGAMESWAVRSSRAKGWTDLDVGPRNSAKSWVDGLTLGAGAVNASSSNGLSREDLASLAHTLGFPAHVGSVAASDFARVELASFGRVFGKYCMARLDDAHFGKKVALIENACKVAIAREARLEEATPTGRVKDQLWYALARQLAGTSSEDDEEFLEDLARHPENRERPLSWGLQYIVRGDVMLDDGSVLALDDLATEISIPALPYLERARDLP